VGWTRGRIAMIARSDRLVGPQPECWSDRYGSPSHAGVYALQTRHSTPIPDLSDTQVIVYTDYKGQAPQVIEDQVTYPLTRLC